MRTLLLLTCLLGPAGAGELGRALRALRADDRQARREVLERRADGRISPGSRSEAGKMERGLKRFFGKRHPGVERALAVRALGRIGGPGIHAMLLDKLTDETDDRVLAAGEWAFRRAPASLAEPILSRVMRAREPVSRAVLLRMLGALPGKEARRRIRLRASMGDHWCPRAAAVHALARDRDRAAFPPLIELLDASDPALVTAAVETLSRLTGRRYGRDVIEWKTWWNTVGKEAPLERVDKARDEDGKPDARRYAHEVT